MQRKLFYKKVSIVLSTFLLTGQLCATSLDELVQSGLSNNSLIKKTDLQIELMEAKKAESKAKKFGVVDVVGSYTHYNLPRTLAPIVPSALSPTSSVDTTQDLFSTGVQYSVPLFTGGALEQQVKIDNIATKMSQSKKRLSREELIYNIRSLYLSALSLQELQYAQENYVVALKSLKEKIRYGVELGKRAKIDLLKANNDLSQSIGNVAKTKSSLKMLKSTLSALTHYNNIQNLETLEVQPIQENPSLKGKDLNKLERFRLQDLEIDKGTKIIKKVEASKKPQVSLNAYAGYNYDIDKIDPIEREQLWQVAINAKWNLFDFGATSARIQQAKIAKLQAISKKDEITEGFKKLFAKAKNEIETALANYETTQSQYLLLQESEIIEQARYDAGVATVNDLLLAKSKTELAKSQIIQSKYAYQNGIFYLDYLLERGVNSILSNEN
jgi:outer membrane protein TolC